MFQGQENIIGKMIADITDIDYKFIENQLILNTNELPISKKNEKAKRCDFIATIGEDMIVNLELNGQYYNGLLIKNSSYLFQLFYTFSKKGEKYHHLLKVKQTNLNCFQEQQITSEEPLLKFQLLEEKSHELYMNNIEFYSLNIAKCDEIYYNESYEKIPNYVRWGALLYCRDFSKIPDIAEGILSKEEIKKIMSKLNQLNVEDLFMSAEEVLEWEEWERNSIIEDMKQQIRKQAIEEGLEQGIEQGIVQGIVQGMENQKHNTILSMLKNNLNLQLIMKITDASKEEILKIKESL